MTDENVYVVAGQVNISRQMLAAFSPLSAKCIDTFTGDLVDVTWDVLTTDALRASYGLPHRYEPLPVPPPTLRERIASRFDRPRAFIARKLYRLADRIFESEEV